MYRNGVEKYAYKVRGENIKRKVSKEDTNRIEPGKGWNLRENYETEKRLCHSG